MPIIAPSLLAADFSNLRQEMSAVVEAPWLHLDVMDGHFVPNISFGMPVIKALRPHSQAKFDVHLMIDPVDPYLEATAKAGADHITVHVEGNAHLHRTLQTIHALGCKAGVAICPATPPEALSEVMDLVDIILVMTVNPGFGGQKFLHGQPAKIRTLAEMIRRSGRDITLGVDGGIDETTTPLVTEAGATMLVAGSAIFGKGDRKAAIEGMRAVARPARRA
ncbi:ribulose-phosphate 3-epimerase [Bombella sp. ESL0378]|uniref:ribulose-phosphate 3-epimerase n=1 Tax=Bombella sp. ESL0378 TaxID=2676442 RepID=UPI0012D9350D|nr:ribulose-phosphate 3-epimerase [Bombella sp. ESL0378]MUG03969.1 ribulose-phosphate 3-epimerase [Bombella sp. ESL0378]